MTSGRVTVVAALGATQTVAWASSYYMGRPTARELTEYLLLSNGTMPH